MPSSLHFARVTIEASRHRWANVQRLVNLSERHETSRHMVVSPQNADRLDRSRDQERRRARRERERERDREYGP